MNELNRLIDKLIKEKGGSRKDYLNLLNSISYHESGHTLDPTIKQMGGGPGRGKYQFEIGKNAGGITAAKRTKKYYQDNNIPVPKWLDTATSSNDLDVTNLTSEQQDVLFLGNMRQHPKADLGKVVKGEESISDFWANYHWAGKNKDRSKRIESFNTSLEHMKSNMPKQDKNIKSGFNIIDGLKAIKNNEQPLNAPLIPNEKQYTAQQIDNTAVNSTINKTGNMDNLISYMKQFAMGGSLNAGNNINKELNSFNTGGLHEENPHGGIPQGTGSNGKLNTVEQGESSFDMEDGKYIFSNRLGLDGIIKEAKQSLNNYATGGNLNTDPKNNYKVQSGDNLSTIAKNNNISLQDLLKNNPQYASNPNQIGIGDDITINSNTSQPTEESPTSFETFNDAFAYNRKTYGANKIFEFEGRKFGTNIAGEEFNPDEAELIENNLPISSTKKRLAEQNKKVKSPVTNKNTVKLEPEFKDWEEVKAEKDDFNKMDQLEVIKQSYKKQNKKGNYIVIDKKKGLAHVYNNDSDEPIYSTAIDIGENTSDAQTVTKINKEKADKNKDGIISKAEAAQATADFSKGNKSTGAGRYTLSNISKDGYQGKPLLNLVNENGVEVATSFHKGFVDDGKSRVSNGCIRCKPATLNYLVDNMKGGEEVYILPEDEGNQFVYENGQLNFRSNNDKDYNSYTDSRGTKRDGQGINTTTNTLNYQPIKIDIDEETFKDEKFTYMDFNDEKEYNKIVKPFVKTLESSKQKVMKLAKINGDVYNDIVKVAFGILGVESNFGDTHSGIGNFGRAIGKYFDKDSSSPDYKSKEGYRELADQESEATSTGLTQIRWNQTDAEDRKLLKEVGITSSKSFLDPKKAALGTMLLLANRYKFQLNDEQKLDIITNLPTTWNNRGNYADRVKTSAKYINIKQKN